MKTDKINLSLVYPTYYEATMNPQLINLEPINYIEFKGKGSPEGQEFKNAIAVLNKLALHLKKKTLLYNRDFIIPNLEGIWWLDENHDFNQTPKELWNWKLRIRMPDFILQQEFAAAQNELIEKLPSISNVKFCTSDSKSFVHALHIGSYEDELPTIEKILDFLQQRNLKMDGHHQEIYLSDPNKTEIKNLKTIIRYPVKKRA